MKVPHSRVCERGGYQRLEGPDEGHTLVHQEVKPGALKRHVLLWGGFFHLATVWRKEIAETWCYDSLLALLASTLTVSHLGPFPSDIVHNTLSPLLAKCNIDETQYPTRCGALHDVVVVDLS